MRCLLFVMVYLVVPRGSDGQSTPCQPPTAYTTLEVNQVRTGLLNGGDFWWDLNNAQYEVPKGSGIHSIFAGGLWIGGIDPGGALRMAAQTYRQSGSDYWPGPLGVPQGGTEPVCLAYDRFWSVNQAEIQDHIALRNQYIQHMSDTIPHNLVAKDILEWPAEGNPYARGYNGVKLEIPIGKKLAPYTDVDGVPGYNPLRGDFPAIRGEEAVWWVFNDLGGEHTETGGKPLGVEVSVMAYGLNWPSYLNHTTFYHFEAVNYGDSLRDTHLGLYVDFDLGYPYDDYVGCDSLLSLGIGYNGTDTDGVGGNTGYGSNPPFLGIDLLRGPRADNGHILPLTSFMTFYSDFSAVGNPTRASHYYNYLRARWLDTSHLKWGGNGYGGTQKVNYIFPSDPSKPGWSECANNNTPFDRRMILATGPFTFEPEERISFDVAVIWRRCDPQPWCPDFSCIQVFSAVTQAWFDAVYPPVGIEEDRLPGPSPFTLFPNPATSFTNLQWAHPVTDDTSITIRDMQGREVFRTILNSGQDHLQVSLEGWPPGVYLVESARSKGNVKFNKLVVTNK